MFTTMENGLVFDRFLLDSIRKQKKSRDLQYGSGPENHVYKFTNPAATCRSSNFGVHESSRKWSILEKTGFMFTNPCQQAG